MTQSAKLGFNCRALRLDLHELGQIHVPCILHWDLNHFVVLKRADRRGVAILDPACGERRMSIAEVSRHFTGVALELTPNIDFRPEEHRSRLALSQLTGRISGLKRSLLQIFCVAFVLEIFTIVAPLFSQMVIDEAITSGDHELLAILAIGFALLLTVQTAIGLARSWMVMVLGQTLALQWSSNLFAHLIRLPADFFEKRHLGDIVSRFGSLRSIQQTLTTSVLEAVLDGVMATAALVMMLVYAPALACVTLAAVIAYGALRWASYGPFRRAAAERLIVAARENTHFLESLRSIASLKLFGREEERRARWQNLVVDVQNRDVRTAKMNIGFNTANTFIFGLENLLVFWFGAKMVMAAMTMSSSAQPVAFFTVGMLFAFVSYKTQFTGRVSALINYAVELKMLGLHAERLADIALSAPEMDTPSSNVAERNLEYLDPSLELRDLSFRYAEGEPWILRHVTFKIEAGESVAITGPSGGGKSTLLKLTLGLLSPSEGEVLYGGVSIRQLGIANVRRCIGTVMQEDVLLTGSLADNICFFDSVVDQDWVEACGKLAQIHAEIVKMPMGYQTHVGDLGSGLSGGQKQRILLARALYKRPRVLALDEATSHLDVDNERLVAQALRQMKHTRMVIAHRPETIAGAQRVVQLRNAQICDVMRAFSRVAIFVSPPAE